MLSSSAVSAGDLLAGAVSSSTTHKSKAEITHAAGEFESILLGQWLQGAESAFGSVPGSSDDADAGDEQMKSFALQSLGKAFTASGGIGLAKMVRDALGETTVLASGQGPAAEKAAP